MLLQKGDDSDPVLQGIHEEVQKLNNNILPKGVKIVPFLDRSDLVKYTVSTVEDNLSAGMILVSIILFLFLGNIRGAIIVALTIPFALLFASICLDLSHIPANLLSLGALDFGMVVDGSVVMIENMVRHLAHPDDTRTPAQKIREAAHEVQRPGLLRARHHHHILPAHLYLAGRRRPTLQADGMDRKLCPDWRACFCHPRCAGRRPAFCFRNGAKEWQNPMMYWLIRHYRTAVRAAIVHRNMTFGISAVLFLIAIYLTFGGPSWIRVSAPSRRRLYLGARDAAPQRRSHREHRFH